MSIQQQNSNADQKPGSADLGAVVDDVEKRSRGDVIPEQPGCGPNVTDYPGLGAPRGDDAQASGSDT